MSFFSIIIANYNSGTSLHKSLVSLQTQSCKDYEVIFIDGGSKDCSIDIAKNHRDLFTVFVSEPDKGIADAWNKGLAYTTGQVIGMLNAGDEYHTDTLQIVKQAHFDNKSDIYYGNCYMIKHNNVAKIIYGKQNSNPVLGLGYAHTTCFVTKQAYQKVGNFDLTRRIGMDTHFLLRCMREELSFYNSNHKVYMSTGGVSDRNFEKGFLEFLKDLKYFKYISRFKYAFFSTLLPIIGITRKLLRFFLSLKVLKAINHILNSLTCSLYSLCFHKSLRRIYLTMLRIDIGQKSSIIPPVKLYGIGKLKIGENTVINSSSVIDNRGNVTIGSNVSIARNCVIFTAGHEINSPYFELKVRDVQIKDYSVIFANCIIQPGVVIGQGAVVLPGTVVHKNVEPYTIVGGNPARKISERTKDLRYTLDYDFWKG